MIRFVQQCCIKELVATCVASANKIEHYHKMKVSIAILLFVSCTVSAQECPVEWFDIILPLQVDETVSINTTLLDPELIFFKDILGMNDAEVDEVFEDCFAFFKRRFGLDFTQSPVSPQGIRVFENAILQPEMVPPIVTPITTNNRWVLNGVLGSNRCFQMREGGLTVFMTGDQMVYGTYGGEEGRRLVAGDNVNFAFFRLDSCEQSPLIIQCQTLTPTFRDPAGFGIRNWECYNRFLGRGIVTGAQGQLVSPLGPEYRRIVVRHQMSFPSHPAGEPDPIWGSLPYTFLGEE